MLAWNALKAVGFEPDLAKCAISLTRRKPGSISRLFALRNLHPARALSSLRALGFYIGNRRIAVYGHHQIGFREEGFEDVGGAFCSAKREAEGIGAADTHGTGAERHGLDHITA